MIYIFLCLISTNPQPDIIPRAYCDRIEFNHYLTEERGQLKVTFKQILLQEWDLQNPRNKDGWACRQCIIILDEPDIRTNSRGLYEFFYKKNKDDLCIIESPQYSITRTTWDRELENRKWWGEGNEYHIFRDFGITPAARKHWRYQYEGWLEENGISDRETMAWPTIIGR